MKRATPYDDVHRTLVTDCKQLMIPMVNEVFGENYSGTEEVILLQNEIFMHQQEETEKRIQDSSFVIVALDRGRKWYHLECQSTIDGSMLVRMYEYDSQAAIQNAVMYSVDEIFEKRLYYLIPFHIFTYEKDFSVYESDKEKLKELKLIYADIGRHLEECCEAGLLDEYAKTLITSMSKKVIRNIARKHSKVRKEVGDIMGGQVLMHHAKYWMTKGISQGISQGIGQNQRAVFTKMLDRGFSKEEAQEISGLDEKSVKSVLVDVKSKGR